MKKETYKIPTGYKVTNFDYKTGEVTLEEKKIETIEDAIEYLTENDEDVKELSTLTPNTKSYNYLALIVVVKALNQGWIADWSNTDEKKWVLWFYLGKNFSHYHSNWHYSNSIAPASLVFKDEETANYASEKFIELFKKVYN